MNTRKHILAGALVMAFVSLSCGINLPVTEIETGPTQKVDLQISLPEEPLADVELNLEFVAGEMKLAPGASDYLASGTATFNVAELEPNVETSGASYTLRQGEQDIKGIPRIQGDLINEWDLQLADTPMSLNIKAGAYTGTFELGGLSLEKLAISDGGANLTSTFSTPNHVEMSSFTYSTGASSAKLNGLANANFKQMSFNSGAGDYALSFDGKLQRDASVTIDTGASTVNLIIPEGVNAQVTFNGALTTINAGNGWNQNGSVYTLSGSGHTITITVNMAAGTLNLKTE